MQVSNTRRICRCYMIDADSILPTTPEMIESIRKLPLHGRVDYQEASAGSCRQGCRCRQSRRPRRRHARYQPGHVQGILQDVARQQQVYQPRQRLLRFHTPADIGRHSIPSILFHFHIEVVPLRGLYRTLYSSTSPQCWLRSGSTPSRIRRDATPLSTATSARERTSTEYSVYPTPSSGTPRHPTAGHRLTRPQMRVRRN